MMLWIRRLVLLAILITNGTATALFLSFAARNDGAFVLPLCSCSFRRIQKNKPACDFLAPIGCGGRNTVRYMSLMNDNNPDIDGASKRGNEKNSKPKERQSPQPKEKQRGGSHQPPKQKQETWRLYGITTHPDDDDLIALQQEYHHHHQQQHVKNQTAPIPSALQTALYKRLKMKDVTVLTGERPIQIVRRSLDARRKLDHPFFNYVVDVILSPEQARQAHLQNRPGKTERQKVDEILHQREETSRKTKTQGMTHKPPPATKDNPIDKKTGSSQEKKKKVLVVGAGPAGLFCALHLALSGVVEPILIERGQPVEKRGRDIGALIHRKHMNKDSNFAFGEGGAGTWSDGKLTTRIGRNSANVRWILEKLVEYGAPSDILWDGAPHLGTNNLVKIIRNMRYDLEDLGATILFGKKLTNIIMDPNNPSVVQGIQVEQSEQSQRNEGDKMMNREEDATSEILTADAIVLATGHSARDVYETLARGSGGVCLEPKGFAVGFRIEHPQKVVTKIQYGNEWGATVRTGKRRTDLANEEYFSGEERKEEHAGTLPVPSYRLATDKARDGTSNEQLRGVYSFCMCPGGQIVLSSTDPSEICVNGMSFSKRDSQWANSALVVTVFPDDPILEPYRERYGVMGGVEFQRDMEKRAATLGGGDLVVPVQRVLDFIDGQVSENIPSSSYRLGVRSAPCHEIYPNEITAALRDALVNHFDAQMPGYLHPDGLLHGVETRTSSPLRIARDAETLQAKGLTNLFPAGEGAGFAGGIVSAAVDGRLVAEAVLDQLRGEDRPGRLASSIKTSVGFQY